METVASQTTNAGCARTASQSGRVSSGFAGASSHKTSASAGGGPDWSNSTTFSPHGANCAMVTPVPK